MSEIQALRPPAEEVYAHELAALAAEAGHRPDNWRLSPAAVVTYIMGGTASDGTTIQPKYFGDHSLIEVAVATLTTDRALLLAGIPGTAKTWVAEHLTAAISGQSNRLVQGTAGLDEQAIRYGWNYALLLAKGPVEEALVPSPVLRAMQEGALVRIEELTRMPSDVQDALITILSEKILPVPELNMDLPARPGFNVVATANIHDRGVNELSSALRRRFNTVVLPLPKTLKEEVTIVLARAGADQRREQSLPALPEKEVERLVTIFRELRSGQTLDGRQQLKQPSSTLSTAEAISVVQQGLAMAAYFGDGQLAAKELAVSLPGAIIKDPRHDHAVWQEYLETVMRGRKGWKDLYRACTEAGKAASV